ncbi:hypothetical protein L7F22_007874 [Adiantum nelumboides]|nr:hypothetical protein [Adiantum nelumboides]
MAYLENHAEGEEGPMATEEDGDEITFLYKLNSGLARKSFGIHCARLAGLPKALTVKASEMADDMEAGVREKRSKGKSEADQGLEAADGGRDCRRGRSGQSLEAKRVIMYFLRCAYPLSWEDDN